MEYANIKIFRRDAEKEIHEQKVNEEIEKFKKTARLSNIVVDNDYNIIESEEAYIAGKRLGLKYLESSRKRKIRSSESDFPLKILMELTNRCNLLCIMCPRNSLIRETVDLDFNLFQKLIDEISKYEIQRLWLYNIGESMLHPRFFEMLEYVNKYPSIHPLWLSTNGNLLDELNAKKLLNSGLDFLNLSLNALDRENYKKISPKSDFNLVMKNLNNFLSLKKKMNKRKPFFRIQMIDIPIVHHQIGKFFEEWGPKVDIINVNRLEKFIGQRDIPTNVDIIDERVVNTEPCKRIDRGFMYIFSNNKVGICATDFNCINCIGDVSEMSINEIWTGDVFKRLYLDIKNKRYDKVPLCYACRDRDLA